MYDTVYNARDPIDAAAFNEYICIKKQKIKTKQFILTANAITKCL